MEAPRYQPTYFVAQEPSRFGGQQEDYEKRANAAIAEVAEEICRCRNDNGDFRVLFFNLIEKLSAIRSQIAKDHGTEDAELFGSRRDITGLPGGAAVLPLLDVYEKYNTKILEVFSKYLSKMTSEGKKEYTESEEYNGRHSSLEIELISVEEREEKGYNIDLIDFLPPYIKEAAYILPEQLTQKQIGEYHQKFRRFKTEFPEEYKIRRMACGLKSLDQLCPMSKLVRLISNSSYVHVRLRTQVDGKLYGITDYFTWMYGSQSVDPGKQIKMGSSVMLHHQDDYLIQPTLEEIAKVFEIAVRWDRDKQDLKVLKDSMTLLCYLLTHNMRDVRGSSAENEWLTFGIYQSLKVECTLDKERPFDLEALCNPLFSQFKEAYNQIVELKLGSLL